MCNSQVTIVIPIYNQSEFLKDAVTSACTQTTPPKHIIIVDDGSTDNTPIVAKNLVKTSSKIPVEYRRFSKSSGIGESFHRAVIQADTEFIIKLDADDVLLPGFLEKLLHGLKTNKKAGWAHCNIQETTPLLKPTRLAHAFKPSGYKSSQQLLPTYIQRNDTCHCVMLRRSSYQDTQGYRSQMKTCEDWHLWLCMILNGAGCYYHSDTLALMRKYPSRPNMAERNRAYIESISWMVQDLMERFPQYKSLFNRLSINTSRLCFGAFLKEQDNDIEQLLLDYYLKMSPTLYRKLAYYLARILPKKTVIVSLSVLGFPRRLARSALIKIRNRNSDIDLCLV